MKKTIGAIICCLLAGCYNINRFAREGPSPGTRYPVQEAAPLPWVSIVPTQRTLELKAVNFHAVISRVRFTMEFSPFAAEFKNTCLVLIDYTILPPEKYDPNLRMTHINDKTFSKRFQHEPERYYLQMLFFDCQNTECPAYEGTVVMPTSVAPPEEALKLMLDEAINDHHASPLKKVYLDLHH